MVEGQGSSTTSPPTLAIDDAIGLLDSLILRLQTSSAAAPQAVAPPKRPLVDTPWPTQSPKKDEPLAPKVALKSAQLTAEQQEAQKGSILDRPGKKPLKLPGASAENSSKAPTAAKSSTPQEVASAENFEKAHFQVGLVHSVADHPISEKLFICKVEVAPGEFRQVVAGLRKFIPANELQQKKVALILNLKPAKLAGQLSEAMILAGDVHADGIETVKVLEPPSDASAGDRIYVEGSTASAIPAKQLSSKVWEKIVPLLKVEGGVATFDKMTLVTSGGALKVPLPDGANIH
ncbi:unnamed protein product [Calypogeia fissa]